MGSTRHTLAHQIIDQLSIFSTHDGSLQNGPLPRFTWNSYNNAVHDVLVILASSVESNKRLFVILSFPSPISRTRPLGPRSTSLLSSTAETEEIHDLVHPPRFS